MSELAHEYGTDLLDFMKKCGTLQTKSFRSTDHLKKSCIYSSYP
jgi:hypothetical protein